MADQLIVKNLDFIKILPAWAQELSYKYCSQTANLYMVYGNIRDFLPHKLYEGEFIFVRIQDYISEVLFGNKDIIAFYDRSSGVNFCTPEMQKEYLNICSRTFPDINMNDFLSNDPLKSFSYLEKYFLMNIPKKQRIVLIIDYAETIVPNCELSRLGEEDRYCLVTLNRWSHDPIFTQGDVSIILLTENLVDLSTTLIRSPSTVKVNIPIPDEKVRSSFLNFLDRQGTLLLEGRLNSERSRGATSAASWVCRCRPAKLTEMR